MKKFKYSFLFLLVNFLNTNSIAQLVEIDTTFNPGTGFNSYVYTCAIQDNGKILVGGAALPYVGYQHQGLARFNADGSFDSTFSSSLSFTDASYNNVVCLVIQPDQKIIVGGTFLKVEGISKSCIVRLNSNGTIDTSFNTGLGANGTVSDVALQVDGKIVIGGNFTTYDGISRNRIARINSNGTIDTTFNPGNGFENNPTFIYTIAIQSDNKILVGGDFETFNGVSIKSIVRLNSFGSLDTTFNQGGSGISGSGAHDFVRKIILDGNGKIYIGGKFNEFNDSININRNICRLNSNGSIDNTFSNNLGIDDQVMNIALQSDGKIVIAGDFESFYAIPRKKIARLNTDGTIDLGFDTSDGPNDIVRALAIQNDEKIIIGGSFLNYGGTIRNRIARIMLLDQTGVKNSTTNNKVQIFPNPTSNKISITSLEEIKDKIQISISDLSSNVTFSDIYINGLQSNENRSIDVSNLSKGIYFVHVIIATDNLAFKLVIN